MANTKIDTAIFEALKRKDKIPINEIVADITTKCGVDRKSVAIRIDALMRSGASSNPSLPAIRGLSINGVDTILLSTQQYLDAISRLDEDSRQVYKSISCVGDKGIPLVELRNMHRRLDITKIIRRLTGENLISKFTPNQSHSTHLIVADLEPQKNLTGGFWFAGGSINEQLVNIVGNYLYQALIKQYNSAFERLANGEWPAEEECQRLVVEQSFSISELLTIVNNSAVFKKRQMCMKDALDIVRVMELDGVVEFVGVGRELRAPKRVDSRPTELEEDPDWLPPAEKALRLESGGEPQQRGRSGGGARGARASTADEELGRLLAADPELPERRYRLCPTRVAPNLVSQRLRWEDVPNQLDYLSDFRYRFLADAGALCSGCVDCAISAPAAMATWTHPADCPHFSRWLAAASSSNPSGPSTTQHKS